MLKKIFAGVGLLLACGLLALLWDVGLRPVTINRALIWKAPEGKANVERGTILDLSFSDDGKTLMSFGMGSKELDAKSKQYFAAHVVNAWDTVTGKPTGIDDFFKTLPATKIKELCGDNIAIGRAGQLVRTVKSKEILEGQTEPETKSFFRNQSIDVLQLPDGKKVWSLSIPDTESGWSLKRFLISPDKRYTFAFFAMKDEKSATWLRSKSELWDMSSGELVWMRERLSRDSRTDYTFLGNSGTVVSIAASEPQKNEAKSQLNVRNEQSDQVLATLPLPQQYAEDQSAAQYATSISPDGNLIAGVWKFQGSQQMICFCWDMRSKALKWQYAEGTVGAIRHVEFSPDGSLVALAVEFRAEGQSHYYRNKAKILVLDSQAGQVKSVLSEETARDLAQQRWLFRAADTQRKINKMMGKADSPTPVETSEQGRYLPGDSGEIFALTFSPDGKTLAAGYASGAIKMWRVAE